MNHKQLRSPPPTLGIVQDKDHAFNHTVSPNMAYHLFFQIRTVHVEVFVVGRNDQVGDEIGADTEQIIVAVQASDFHAHNGVLANV